MSTWIKLYRSAVDSQVFAHAVIFKIWCWLLIKATHKEKFVDVKVGRGKKVVRLKRGQLMFGRHIAEDALGIDGSTIYKHIHTLEEWGNIKIQSNTHHSVITICNYDEYQDANGEEEQHSNNEIFGMENFDKKSL